MTKIWMGGAGLLAASLISPVSRAQPATQPAGDMTVVLVFDDGRRTPSLVPLVGTLIFTRNDPAPVGPASEPPDKLQMVFSASIWSDPAVVHWLAESGSSSSAVFTVTTSDNIHLEYTLTGITSRNLTVTEQEGMGQASMVLGSTHVSIGGVAVN